MFKYTVLCMSLFAYSASFAQTIVNEDLRAIREQIQQLEQRQQQPIQPAAATAREITP